jgi:hypothetical protein
VEEAEYLVVVAVQVDRLCAVGRRERTRVVVVMMLLPTEGRGVFWSSSK